MTPLIHDAHEHVLFPANYANVPRTRWVRSEEVLWFWRLRIARAYANELPDLVWKGRLATVQNLVAKNFLALVYAIARSIAGSPKNPIWDDLIGAGSFGLARAMDKYDVRQRFRFSTLA